MYFYLIYFCSFIICNAIFVYTWFQGNTTKIKDVLLEFFWSLFPIVNTFIIIVFVWTVLAECDWLDKDITRK